MLSGSIHFGSMLPCSCSLLAWLCSYATSISRSSGWCCHGSAFARPIPIFRHDSPYSTPLSLPAWHIVTGIPFLTFRALRRLTYLQYFSGEAYRRFHSLEESYRKLLMQGMQTVEETALNAPSEIDTRAFLWTFDSLDEIMNWSTSFLAYLASAARKLSTILCPDSLKSKNGRIDRIVGPHFRIRFVARTGQKSESCHLCKGHRSSGYFSICVSSRKNRIRKPVWAGAICWNCASSKRLG